MTLRATTLRVLPVLALLLLGFSAVPGVANAQVKGPAPYASEIRDKCIAEMEKDDRILAACEGSHSSKYHVLDAKQAITNKQFVVAAYAALWGIVTIFVLVLWLRQRKLSVEITRLQAELKKAAAE
ncbi:MAG: hypothetical protein GY811_13465 [Myxococcales bacterium]|nr:hypothetical protein [Myxococcales bacterium]